MKLKYLVFFLFFGFVPNLFSSSVTPIGCGMIREFPLNEAAKRMIASSETLRTTLSQYLAGEASFKALQALLPIGTFIDFFIDGGRVHGVVSEVFSPNHGHKGTLRIAGENYSNLKGEIPIEKIEVRSLSMSPAISQAEKQQSYKLFLEAKNKGYGVTFISSLGHSKSKGRVVNVSPDGGLTLDEDMMGDVSTSFSNVHPSTIYLTEITPSPLNDQESAVLQFLTSRKDTGESLSLLVAHEHSEIAPVVGPVTDIRVGVDGEYRVLFGARQRGYRYIRLSSIIANSLLSNEIEEQADTSQNISELKKVVGRLDYTVLFVPKGSGGFTRLPAFYYGFVKDLRLKTDGTYLATIESSDGSVTSFNPAFMKNLKVVPVLSLPDQQGFLEVTAMINQAKAEGNGVTFNVNQPGVSVKGFIDHLRIGADGRKYLVVIDDDSGKKVFTRFDLIRSLKVLPKVEL